MGELGVLFNPGMRHEQEEKLAKQMLREDEGTGRKGRLGIDLESGIVVIDSHDDNDADRTEPARRPGRGAEPQAGKPTDEDDSRADAGSRADATSRGAASEPQPGEARPARRAMKAAPAGKAKRRSADVVADAPVGKSRRQSH